jgi:hypothetical protein
MRGLSLGVVGSAVGGAIGAAIWAAIAYFAHFEIGYIAVGVGALAGVGMAIGAGSNRGFVAGVIAAGIALASVAAGKYAAVHFEMKDHTGKLHETLTLDESDYKLFFADQLVEEYVGANKELTWRNGKTRDEAHELGDYPANLCKDLEARWKAMTPEKREAYCASADATIRYNFQQAVSSFESSLAGEGFTESLSAFDLLWAFLALGAAYRIGAAVEPDEA